jgi:hypothetical protein
MNRSLLLPGFLRTVCYCRIIIHSSVINHCYFRTDKTCRPTEHMSAAASNLVPLTAVLLRAHSKCSSVKYIIDQRHNRRTDYSCIGQKLHFYCSWSQACSHSSIVLTWMTLQVQKVICTKLIFNYSVGTDLYCFHARQWVIDINKCTSTFLCRQ